jgi:C1A family cysteine protease
MPDFGLNDLTEIFGFED